LRSRGHIRLFLIATLVWAAFWLGGQPAYYQQYSTQTMTLFSLVTLVLIIGVVCLVLRGIRRERRLAMSAWFAFYFTVPLAIYDWLYCGVFLGHGMKFLSRYWYLSIYYVIPWIVLPSVALMFDRRGARGAGNADAA
jgi:hypothetical protein